LSLGQLVAFDGLIAEQRGAAIGRIHDFVKEALKKDSSTVISQSFLSKPKTVKKEGVSITTGCGGFSRPAVKSYLKLVGFS